MVVTGQAPWGHRQMASGRPFPTGKVAAAASPMCESKRKSRGGWTCESRRGSMVMAGAVHMHMGVREGKKKDKGDERFWWSGENGSLHPKKRCTCVRGGGETAKSRLGAIFML